MAAKWGLNRQHWAAISCHRRRVASAMICIVEGCAPTTSQQLVPIDPVDPRTAIRFMGPI
jgi:hypothetical protein